MGCRLQDRRDERTLQKTRALFAVTANPEFRQFRLTERIFL